MPRTLQLFDKDLIELNPFMSAKIITPAEFERKAL